MTNPLTLPSWINPMPNNDPNYPRGATHCVDFDETTLQEAVNAAQRASASKASVVDHVHAIQRILAGIDQRIAARLALVFGWMDAPYYTLPSTQELPSATWGEALTLACHGRPLLAAALAAGDCDVERHLRRQGTEINHAPRDFKLLTLEQAIHLVAAGLHESFITRCLNPVQQHAWANISIRAEQRLNFGTGWPASAAQVPWCDPGQVEAKATDTNSPEPQTRNTTPSG